MMPMSAISPVDASPGLIQLAMMRKVMDTARIQMSGLLQAMPAPVQQLAATGHPGSLDTYL